MMRAEHRTPRAILAVLALAFAVSAFAGDALAKKPWEKFDFPELGDVTVPDYERHVLDNGLTIYLLEDRTWPLVEGEVLVRTGAAFEPASKVGLASVTGDVLRTGGTTNISADELDEKLESMGAYIESGINDTQGSVDFSFLSKDAKEGLRLVADVLRNPSFDQEKIDVSITAERAGIARRNDDLNGIVGREIQRAVWGEDHPYARNIEYGTLDAITRDDIVGFYDYYYNPDNMMIAVWGDFDPAEMLTTLREQFGDWPQAGNMIPDLPNEPTAQQDRRVYVANKDDVNQARFAVGTVGMRADDPDYYAMSVANRILGGGFGDRLFNEVRTNRGLAYNVGSSPGVGFSAPGVFQAYCGTKSETTEEALGVVLDTVEKMRTEPVTDKELKDAKEGMLASNVFNYVNPSQVLTRKMALDYLGYPEDFLETYNEKVRAIGVGEVQDVMERRVDPSTFAIVAVGKVEDWDGDLTGFGPVSELDISIPEPEGPEFPEPTDETVEKGRSLLAAAQKAHGGRAVTSLKSVKRDASMSINFQGMNLSASSSSQTVFPDRSYNVMQLPFGEMIQATSPEACWAKTPQGLQDITGEQADEMRLEVVSDPLYLLGHYDSFVVQQLPAEDVDGKSADVVLVWLDDEAGEWLKLYLDPADHTLLKTQEKGNNPLTQAPGIMDVYYEDYKTVGGLKVSHAQRLLHDGEELIGITITKFVANPEVDASIFEKPAS